MKNLKIYTLLVFILTLTSCQEDFTASTATGTLRGTVKSHTTLDPIPNVRISTSPSTQTIYSNENGEFEISNVPIGDYSVTAEISGYVTGYEAVNLNQGGQEVSLIIELEDDETLNTPPSIPTAVTPTDFSQNMPNEVTLSWNCTDADEDPLTYTLQIRNSLNDDIQNINDLDDTSYTLYNLNYGMTYFWQITVNDGVNEDVYSSVYQFSTSDFPQNRYHYTKNTNGVYQIFTTNLQNENILLSNPNQASWRPKKNNTANRIAYLKSINGETFLMSSDLNGNSELQVSPIPLRGFNYRYLNYSWHQNGGLLIFPDFDKLYRVNNDGTNIQMIYQTTGSYISDCSWSHDGSMIALSTNDVNGYQSKIYIIDMNGNVLYTVLDNVSGAAGGLNFSITDDFLLYTHDVSGYESSDYRQLNTHIFLYDLANNTSFDLSDSSQKPNGTIDLDPMFSPNNAEIIFTNTSNDMISARNIYTMRIDPDHTANNRSLIIANGEMPNWK